MRSLHMLCIVGAFAVSACQANEPRGAADVPRLVAIDRESHREVAVRWLSLTACDSANSEFVLCFEPRDGSGADRDLLLACGEWEPANFGGHTVDVAKGADRWHHCSHVAAADVELIAAATGLEPARYVSRDVELVARFAVEGDTFPLGGHVPVRVELENRGRRAVRENDDGPIGTSQTRWSFHATRAGEVMGELYVPQSQHADGVPDPLQIPPGASVIRTDLVDQHVLFTAPGEYELRVAYVLLIDDLPPAYSRDDACPRVREECSELFTATLRCSLRD